MKLDSPSASTGAISVRTPSTCLKQKCQFLPGVSRDFGRGGDALTGNHFLKRKPALFPCSFTSAGIPYGATLCCSEAIGTMPAYPHGGFCFSLGPSKRVYTQKQKIKFTKEAHFRCRCSMGCCTKETCLLFNIYNF